jgi:hypothetical protein
MALNIPYRYVSLVEIGSGSLSTTSTFFRGLTFEDAKVALLLANKEELFLSITLNLSILRML